MKIAPQTIGADLVDRLNSLRSTGTYLAKNTIKWMQIKRECDKLVQADPVEGWAVSGMLYALAGDADETDKCFNRALRLTDLFGVRINWMASIGSLGFASRAQKMYAELGSPSLGALWETLGTGIGVGAFQMILQNIDLARKMGLDLSTIPTDLLEETAKLLAEAGIPDADVAKHIDAAGAVLRDQGMLMAALPTLLTTPASAGFPGVTMVLYIARDESEIFSFNKALARKERELAVQKADAFDIVFASSVA